MRTLAVDVDDDISPELAVVDGLESARQRVAQRVRLFLGEWFLDASAGVPYHRDVFVRPATPALALAIITRAIRTVPGVTDVKDVAGSIDNASRTLTYSATVVTGDGNFGVAESV